MGDRSILENIKRLETEVLTQGRKKLAGLTELLGYTEAASTVVALQAIQSLRSIFTSLVDMGDIGICAEQIRKKQQKQQAPGVHQEKYLHWISDKYDSFLKVLMRHVQSNQNSMQTPAFNTVMHLIKAQSDASARFHCGDRWDKQNFLRLMWNTINSPNLSQEFLEYVMTKHIRCFGDINLRFLEAIPDFIHRGAPEEVALEEKARALTATDLGDSLVRFMWAYGVPPQSELPNFFVFDADSLSGKKSKKRKRNQSNDDDDVTKPVSKALKTAYSSGWMAVATSASLSPASIQLILQGMHTRILPRVNQPLRLADFLIACYSHGGAISVLSLDSLFVLMRDFKLEYPDFYLRLYGLFDHTLLHSKFRDRFFELSEKFLSSGHLPAYLVAAFIKRTCRLCLQAPPTAIQLALMFVHNTVNRHRACMCLLNRPSAAGSVMASDPFRMDESDPAKSNALESSLWELELLFEHYFPDTAHTARTFQNDFKLTLFDLSTVQNLSYSKFFDKEVGRKVKLYPVAFAHVQSLFDLDAAMKHWEFN
eukprot:c4742_g1_i1.p1 GENE.c4742_g1_i1~~c4742_g1_i1.p1  ORF type:complete len:553 (+),score=131.91 c4742_g1_i1:46-1659(+)